MIKHKDKLIVFLYYLRKLIIGLLCFLIAAGLLLVTFSLLVKEWAPEMTSLSISTGITFLLLMWVLRYKRPIEMYKDIKKERGNTK